MSFQGLEAVAAEGFQEYLVSQASIGNRSFTAQGGSFMSQRTAFQEYIIQHVVNLGVDPGDEEGGYAGNPADLLSSLEAIF
jgi:hypothetical protein